MFSSLLICSLSLSLKPQPPLFLSCRRALLFQSFQNPHSTLTVFLIGIQIPNLGRLQFLDLIITGLLHSQTNPDQTFNMSWSFGTGVNDFIVPKDHEMLDRLPTENWLQWGKTDYESMESLSKYIVPENTRPDHMGMSANAVENRGSSRSAVLPEDSVDQNTLPHRQPTYFLNEEGEGADHADDIFFPFLDEDYSAMESLNESFGFSPEFQFSSTQNDASMSEMISDSQRVPDNQHGIRSSKNLQVDAFSPLQGRKMEECSTSHSIPSTLDKESGCTSVETSSMVNLPVLAAESGALAEKTSIEESVLQEFRRVMSQMPQKTRICFRDGLYRLAKNSEQQQHMSRTNEFISDSRPRSGTAESETNVIDRAIANLMFNKMEVNAQHMSAGGSFNRISRGDDARVPTVHGRNQNRHFQELMQ